MKFKLLVCPLFIFKYIKMNDDCFLCIVSFLPVEDIKNCLLLCKHVNKIIKHAHFWKMRFDTDFKGIVCTNNFYNNYKQYCVLDNFLVKEKPIVIYTNYCCLYLTKQFDIYRLQLHHKGLHTIPHEIGLLTQLTSLHLQANNLQTIPSSIFELTNLKILCLNHNKLQIISPEIGQLTNLAHLYLYDNSLQTIPETIVQCTMLYELHIDKEQRKFVPQIKENIIIYH